VTFVRYVLAPNDLRHLTVFYLVWIVVFLVVNIAWDCLTPLTPNFRIHSLRGKIGVLHGGAAFCSSLLIISALIDEEVAKIARDTVIPLILAGFSGMLLTAPAMCPYAAVATVPNADSS
jgi:hypothetical protein